MVRLQCWQTRISGSSSKAGVRQACRYHSIVRAQPLLERRPAAPIRSAPAAWSSRPTGGRSPRPACPAPRTSGSTPVPASRQISSHHVEHSVGPAAAGVERLARGPRRGRVPPQIARYAPPRPRRRGSLAPGEPSERTTGERPASAAVTASGTSRERVDVAAAVQVREPRHRDRQLPGVPVGARQQVGRGLGDVVGVRGWSAWSSR